MEAVVQVVDRLWERQAADVPGWAAQELAGLNKVLATIPADY